MPLFLLRLPLAYIKVGQALAECDMGCPFSKLVVSSPIDLRGYPLSVTMVNCALKSIRAHLDPGSACVNCLYSCHILYLWHTFLMGHTANF